MKAIATLAVLGLAYAGEHRENPRFRAQRGVISPNADHEFRSTTRVSANDNNGMMMIMGHDDADNELIGLNLKNKKIDGSFNTGSMDINIHNDDADNELRSTTRVSANDNNGMMMIMGNDDELFLDMTIKNTNVNADHNSGMMNVNIHNNDDELFLDMNIKNTNVNANHNSGMMNVNIHNHDDADNELASTLWKTNNVYQIPNKQGGFDSVHVKTENQVHDYAGNTGVRVINADDADDELLMIPIKPWEKDYIRDRRFDMYRDDADNELASTLLWKTNNIYQIPNQQGGFDSVHVKTENQVNNYAGNTGVRIINKDDADNELIGFTMINKNIDGSHNSGSMDINIHNDDELFLDFHHQSTNVNANHNSGMMNVNIHNDDADNEPVSLFELLREKNRVSLP